MATVKGGLFANYSGTYLTNYSGKSSNRRAAAKALDQLKAFQKIAITLNGTVAGSAALATRARVQASEQLGGRRVIETFTFVNRNTTAADKTEVDNDLETYGGLMTVVPNLDRNPLGWR